MSDIDFDELDRAVNSLITSQPLPSSTPPGEPKEKVLNIGTPKTPQSSNSDPVEIKTPVSQAPTPTPTPVSPVIERRAGGQFMDVVHPSSNMRTQTLVMPDRNARQQNIASAQNSRTFVKPDVNAPIQQPQPISTSVNTISNPVVPAQPADMPQSSPFISDAKVEKRPLGAFSIQPQVEPMSADSVTPMPAEATAPVETATLAQKMPTRDEETAVNDPKTLSTSNEGITKSPVNVEAPLPAELQNDLLLIESGSAVNLDETLSDDNLATAATVAATSSINQQYAEKPSTGDQKSGAIFDTKAYHKAPMGSAKKKSGWMKVVLILLILLIGAGAGAAVYWFVLK